MGEGHHASVHKICKDEACTDCFVYKIGKIEEKEILMTQAAFHETVGLHGHEHITEPIEIINITEQDEAKTVLVMKEISPYTNDRGTFVDLKSILSDSTFFANKDNDVIWRSIMLQIIGTFADIQKKIVNFRHNDLNLSNIMLSNASEDHECSFISKGGRKLVTKPNIHITMIDFAFASDVETKLKPIHSDIYLFVQAINRILNKDSAPIIKDNWTEFSKFVLTKPLKFETIGELLDHPYFDMFGDSSGRAGAGAGGTRRRRRRNHRRNRTKKIRFKLH